MPTTTARRGRRSRGALPGRPALRRLPTLLWLLPAATAYAMFVLYPLTQTVRYSLYDWNGIGQAVWVGAANYVTVVTDPTLYESLLHTIVLILFFSFVPITAGLIAATFIRDARSLRVAGAARTILFLPQIVPLAAAAIAWTWLYADDGLINGVLRGVGAGDLARPWLADFDAALPAVGLVGSWAMVGFCTVLFLAGIGRIDVSLYEAARLDGASGVQEFFAVTLPGLRHEILVCATVTLIAAIASFDLVYMMTGGGPGFSTMVPGVQIVRLAFTEGRVGLASALAVVLLVVVLIVVLPLQRFGRDR
jgi:raffinose/stachyose/melibiose transport system permease protein